MNERIRELDAQAVEYALGVCDANGLYQGKEYLQVVKEKFAELIVKECMRLNSKELSITAIERLLPLYKEHFGVEE